MNLIDAQQYCLDKTLSSGSSFYHSFRFLPEDQRKAMTALYAFCREVDDVVDENLDEKVARKELVEWREHIRKLYEGELTHPVTIALADCLQSFSMQESHMQELIDGMEMDLDQQRYDSFKDLSLYCYRVASVVGLLSAEIFGYTNRKTQKYAHDLGLAFQLTNILRDVKEDSERGRIYIPMDELERFRVPVEHLKMDVTSPEAQRLFKHQAERAQSYYDKAFGQLPEEDRYSQRTGLIMSAVYHRILEEIESRDYALLEGEINISKSKKVWAAWQAARKEKKRFQKYQAMQQRADK